MLIAKINLRYCIDGMQHIYERVRHITKIGLPMRSITTDKRVDLTGLIGAQDMWASFEQYQ